MHTEIKEEKTIIQQAREQEMAHRAIDHNSTTEAIQIHDSVPMSDAAEVVTARAADDAQTYNKSNTFKFTREEGAAAFMRVLLREGMDAFGKPSGGGPFSPPKPPETISTPEQIFVYEDCDGNREIDSALYNGDRTAKKVLLTTKNLMDGKLMPMPMLVKYAAEQGLELPRFYSERDRLPIIENLVKRFKIVDCIVVNLAIPWGAIELKGIGVAHLSVAPLPEYGHCFNLHVLAPKAKESEVDALFLKIEEELKYRSLHTGRALDSAQEGANFMNPFVTDRSKMIWSDTFREVLDDEVLGPINDYEAFDEAGEEEQLNQSNCFGGKVGTGKSATLNICMQDAIQAGMTVIKMRPQIGNRPGDTLQAVMTKAAKYPRGAMVIIEDFDVIVANCKTMQEEKELQDLIDGTLTKGQRITVVVTTNHQEVLTEQFIRRFGVIIDFPLLDRDGVEKFFKMSMKTDPSITAEDWNAIYDQCKDWPQVFMMYAVKSAKRKIIRKKLEFVTLQNIKTAILFAEGLYKAYEKAPKERVEKTSAQIADEYQREVIKQTVVATMQDLYIESENSNEVFGIHAK